MAEGFLKHFHPDYQIFSAGTRPEKEVNPFAVKVMKELDIDISNSFPKNVSEFVNGHFDYVITVCDNAKESCPVFSGKVTKKLHIGFEDPADAQGTEEEKLKTYRRIRDQIKTAFINFKF
jgi:arsenate reductase